jgi:hypothetical protein
MPNQNFERAHRGTKPEKPKRLWLRNCCKYEGRRRVKRAVVRRMSRLEGGFFPAEDFLRLPLIPADHVASLHSRDIKPHLGHTGKMNRTLG